MDIALTKIRVRNHNALALQASLHGIKVEMIKPASDSKAGELSPVNQAMVDKAMDEAIERKRREFDAKSK